jgi:hypothetical protein
MCLLDICEIGPIQCFDRFFKFVGVDAIRKAEAMPTIRTSPERMVCYVLLESDEFFFEVPKRKQDRQYRLLRIFDGVFLQTATKDMACSAVHFILMLVSHASDRS